MRRLIQTFLLISFLLCIYGCAPYKDLGNFEKILPKNISTGYFAIKDSSHLYNVTLNAFKNKINGILAVKTMDKQQQRVALLSEFGNTLFDMEFDSSKIIINYVMPDLNKKIILNKLSKYFQLLLNNTYLANKELKTPFGQQIYKAKYQRKTVYLEFDKEHLLKSLLQTKGGAKKISIQYYSNASHLDSVKFKSFKLPIKMTLYSRN